MEKGELLSNWDKINLSKYQLPFLGNTQRVITVNTRKSFPDFIRIIQIEDDECMVRFNVTSSYCL